MLRKLLSLVVACALFVLPAHAVLKVDIVAGGVSPISVAVLKFETTDGVKASDAAMIREVVEADLKRTGLFHIVSKHEGLMKSVKFYVV